MPWKERCAVDERMRLMVDYESGEEPMAALCRRYGVSRKTAYKWLHRFLAGGVEGLKDRGRAPKHHPNEVCEEVEAAILGGVGYCRGRSRWPRATERTACGAQTSRAGFGRGTVGGASR